MCLNKIDKMDLANKQTRSGKLFKDIDCFVNSSGDPIYCKYWKPVCEPKGLILLVHGFAEHCARYERFATQLTELGLLVFGNDHAAHGENPGYFLDVLDYKQFIKDALQHVDIMKTKYPDLPMYIFGHSMGGCIAAFLASQAPELFKGVVFSSPMLTINPEFTKFKVLIASALESLFPRIPVGALNPALITRDEKEVEKYVKDPLVYTGPVRLRTGYQLYLMAVNVQPCISKIDIPFLVLHGDKDEICDISGSHTLLHDSLSKDKRIRVFEGAKHELLHEIDDVPADFVAEVKSWVSEHLEGL